MDDQTKRIISKLSSTASQLRPRYHFEATAKGVIEEAIAELERLSRLLDQPEKKACNMYGVVSTDLSVCGECQGTGYIAR